MRREGGSVGPVMTVDHLRETYGHLTTVGGVIVAASVVSGH